MKAIACRCNLDHYSRILKMMKSKEAIPILSAPASESRLAVFQLLVRRGRRDTPLLHIQASGGSGAG